MKTFFTTKDATENQERKTVKGVLTGFLFEGPIDFIRSFFASVFLSCFSFAPFASFAVNNFSCGPR